MTLITFVCENCKNQDKIELSNLVSYIENAKTESDYPVRCPYGCGKDSSMVLIKLEKGEDI